MVVRRALAHLAKKAPVPAFLISGIGGDDIAHGLRLDDRLHLMDSPRPAMVLIVAGRLTTALVGPAQQVHDQMADPRAVVQWSPNGPELLAAVFPHAVPVESAAAEDAAAALAAAAVAARDDLLAGRLASSPSVLPDADPNPWRGLGPYGQGGTGMTGGVPYGRPLPGRAKDRDGLELDQLLVRVGPFLAPLPEGLVLDVRLQGDVIQGVIVGDNPFVERVDAGPPWETPPVCVAPADLQPFLRSLHAPAGIAELELVRARHHLRWLGHMLRVHGLAAIGRRALGMSSRTDFAATGVGHRLAVAEVAELRRSLERNVTLTWVTRGIGVLSADQLAALDGGPVVRAAGVERDERLADPAYRALGFKPLTLAGGDALARWRLRLREVEQSLALAGGAGASVTTVTGTVEGPAGALGRGPTPSARLLTLLPDLLVGLEWGDAVTTLVSLDLDLREAALTPSEPAPAVAR